MLTQSFYTPKELALRFKIPGHLVTLLIYRGELSAGYDGRVFAASVEAFERRNAVVPASGSDAA